MEVPVCPDGPMFQGLPMFPGEVPATRDVMVVKETPSFVDALLFRELVDPDTVAEILTTLGKMSLNKG